MVLAFRTLSLIFALLWLQSCTPPIPESEPQKLSVLFILVDDLNTRLGTYGDPVVQSPSIDHLAALGVRFDRAFSQYPMCNASRSSLLSGLYPEFTGVLTNGTSLRNEVGDIALLPEYFRHYGYYTHGVGKIEHHPNTLSWGEPLGDRPIPPKAAGRRPHGTAAVDATSLAEDERLDTDPAADSDTPSPLADQASHPSGSRIRRRGTESKKPLRDERTAMEAIHWLEENQDKTFFLAVGFDSTHLPFVAPRRFLRRYPPYTIQLRREPPGHLEDVPLIALTHHPSDAVTDREHRDIIAQYYACVSYIDAQVGRLLAAMERLGLSDRTVVVLTSDHGFLLGEHDNHWRKGSLFSESARVPLIIAGPGIAVGIPSRQPAELLDLYPTLVQLAGLPRPEGSRVSAWWTSSATPSSPASVLPIPSCVVSGVSSWAGRSRPSAIAIANGEMQSAPSSTTCGWIPSNIAT
jgi:uncharacterized sulfatase